MTKSVRSILAGAIAAIGFSPVPFGWVALIVGLAYWLWTIKSEVSETDFYQTFYFSMGLFGTALSWVFVSIYYHGHVWLPLALLMTVLFIALLSVIHALPFLVLRRFPAWLSPACGWVMGDIIQAHFLSGFPFGHIAHAFTQTWLSGYAPLLGSYGLTFLVLLVLTYSVGQIYTQRYKSAGVAVVLFCAAGFLANLIVWTVPDGEPIDVVLIQGNISQSERWHQVIQHTDWYIETASALKSAELILMPEGAIEIPFPESLPHLEPLDIQADSLDQGIILGLPILQDDGSYTNAAIGLGSAVGRYEKRKLVPFGEYVPGPAFIRRWVETLSIPMSNFTPGALMTPILFRDKHFQPLICYEVAFPHLWYPVLKDTDVLVSLVNNGWFGRSFASHQQWQMASFYAKASGKPFIQVSNSGVTGSIDASGHIVDEMPAFTQGILRTSVQLVQGRTLWSYMAEGPMMLVILVILLVGWAYYRIGRTPS